jgi:hypothetical protein
MLIVIAPTALRNREDYLCKAVDQPSGLDCHRVIAKEATMQHLGLALSCANGGKVAFEDSQ